MDPPFAVVDLDASLEPAGGRIHLGPYRSPVHTPRQTRTLARAITRRAGVQLAGLMSRNPGQRTPRAR